jgi:hypothetical protein
VTKEDIARERSEIKVLMSEMLGAGIISIADLSEGGKRIWDINWQHEDQCLAIHVEGFVGCIDQHHLPVGQHEVTVIRANPSEFGFVITTREIGRVRMVFSQRPECSPTNIVGYTARAAKETEFA